MCTAAGRKFQRVQLSISCQGVRTLPLVGGCDSVVLNGLVVFVSCDEWETVEHCVIVLGRMGMGLHQTTFGIRYIRFLSDDEPGAH